MKTVKVFFAAVLMLQSVAMMAQDDLLKKADRLYAHNAYSEAADIYITYLQQSYNYDINYKLAECYRNMHMLSDAVHWYKILMDQNNADAATIYNYAVLLKANGNYKSAKNWFLKYAAYNEDGYYMASTCDWAMANAGKPQYFIIDTIGINTPMSEMTPTFFKKGFIYSATAGDKINVSTGMPYYDLIFAEPAGDTAWKTSPLGNWVNSEMHEGAPCYDINSKILYFTRNNHYKNRTIRSGDGNVNLELFFSAFTEGDFSKPRPTTLNSNDYSVGQPAISPDGNIIIFVSDKPGGNGGTDLYYAVKKGGVWGQAINMGDAINTKGNELFPFMTSDGTLYFASDYLPGFGGLDIFKSTRISSSWSVPENIGAPVNSPQDDFAFILRNGAGYFTSNRPGGKGSDDIYQVTQLLGLTRIYVYDTSLKPVSKARVTLVESPKTQTICETDATGYGDISSVIGPGISIRIAREGFLDKTISNVGNLRSSNGVLPVELQPLLGDQEHTPEKPVEEPVHEGN